MRLREEHIKGFNEGAPDDLKALLASLPSVVEEVISRGVKPDIDYRKLPSWTPSGSSWSYKKESAGNVLARPPRPDLWIVSDGVFEPGPTKRHGFANPTFTDDGQDIWAGVVVDNKGKLYECRIACTRMESASIQDVLSNLGSYPAELRTVLPFSGLGANDQLTRDGLAQHLRDFAQRTPPEQPY